MKDLRVSIVRGLIVLLSRFPLKFHYFMGDILSWLAKNVIKYRTELVMMNVSRAFPEKKLGEIRQIYHDFYRHFGEIVAEAIWFAGCDYKRLNKSGIVTVMNAKEVLKSSTILQA